MQLNNKTRLSTLKKKCYIKERERFVLYGYRLCFSQGNWSSPAELQGTTAELQVFLCNRMIKQHSANRSRLGIPCVLLQELKTYDLLAAAQVAKMINAFVIKNCVQQASVRNKSDGTVLLQKSYQNDD